MNDEEKMQRATDTGRIVVSRVIPLPWLIGAVLVILGHGIVTWHELTNLVDATRENTIAIRAIQEAAATKAIADGQRDVRIENVERRVTALEQGRR